MKRARSKGVKKILLRLPTELAEILDERVDEWRSKGVPASRTYVLVQAIESYLCLAVQP